MKGSYKMAFRLHGVKVPHRKHTEGMSAVRMSLPKTVIIPTSMHIGAPAKPVVKVGDSVKIGTLIAEASGFVSAPIYSGVSGTVKGIEEFLLSNGKTAPAIKIDSDGLMEIDESVKPPVVDSKESLLNAIKESGIVGLGGAGFPTFVKLNTEKTIEELVINGAECEPYITSDSVTMVDCKDDIAFAIENFLKYLNIGKVVIGIENNKPRAIDAMKDLAKNFSNVTVKVLPPVYPQGGEKVLVYHTTGKVIPMGGLPIDVGCVVCNSTTMATIGKYLKTGMPLVEKCVTVDGEAVAKPQNVIVPIGTSLSDVFEFCGGFKTQPAKVLYGGPMMGIAVPDITAPILKNTNAILALSEKEAKLPETTACIKCGSCANHCPFGIDAAAIGKAYRNDDMEKLEAVGTTLCMECGCCSFVCPANRPLVQTNKLAKSALRDYKAKEAK